jgi:signal peptidase II
LTASVNAWLRAGLVAAAVFVADQVTKQVAIDRLQGEAPVDLPLGFELDYVTNTGIAFGLLSNGQGLVIALTVVTLVLLAAWLAHSPRRPWLWLASGLLIGGALGNLADRVGEGAVVDFIDPPRWPAFNLADVAITAGVVLVVLSQARMARR